MHKKKFKWTKKNILISSISGLVVLSALIWGIIAFLDKDQVETKPIEEEPRQISKGKEEVKTSSYEKLLGLDYTVLRTEKIVDESKDNTLFFDIQVEKALEEEQLISLGKEAYQVLSKEIDKDSTISSVNLNVFTNKEAYEKTTDLNYNGEYVEGLVQTFTSTHLNGNKAMVKTYNTFTGKTDVESDVASLDFDVVNANFQETERIIEAEVVVTGEPKEVQNFITDLIAMLKEENEEAVHVALHLYESQKNYEDGKSSYEYSTLNPTLLTKYSQLNF